MIVEMYFIKFVFFLAENFKRGKHSLCIYSESSKDWFMIPGKALSLLTAVASKRLWSILFHGDTNVPIVAYYVF